MKIFLDTADMNLIKEAAASHLIDGVTTNPSLIAKIGRSYQDIVTGLCQICSGPLSVEVLAEDTESMMKEARMWRTFGSQVVIKIPLTKPGLSAIKMCADEGIPTNGTLCFSPLQALLAAKAGVTYISPFIGRLDDQYGQGSGILLVKEIKDIYDAYGLKTQILVASVRSLEHITQAARLGAHCITIPPQFLSHMLEHPLTDKGMDIFRQDSARIPLLS